MTGINDDSNSAATGRADLAGSPSVADLMVYNVYVHSARIPTAAAATCLGVLFTVGQLDRSTVNDSYWLQQAMLCSAIGIPIAILALVMPVTIQDLPLRWLRAVLLGLTGVLPIAALAGLLRYFAVWMMYAFWGMCIAIGCATLYARFVFDRQHRNIVPADGTGTCSGETDPSVVEVADADVE